MDSLYCTDKPQKRFLFDIIIMCIVIVIQFALIINYYFSTHHFGGVVFYLLWFCVVFSISPILHYNSIYQINTDDKSCTFISIHRTIIIKMSHLYDMIPLYVRGHGMLTILFYKDGLLLIYGNMYSEKELEPFFKHVNSINNKFTRYKSWLNRK